MGNKSCKVQFLQISANLIFKHYMQIEQFSLLFAFTTLVNSFFLATIKQHEAVSLVKYAEQRKQRNVCKLAFPFELLLNKNYQLNTTSVTPQDHHPILNLTEYRVAQHKEIMDWKSSFCSSLENSSWLNFKSGAAVKQSANQQPIKIIL